jgi:hypothetical protein
MTLPRELTLVRAVAVAVLLLALAATPAMASPCTADGETLCGDGGQATAARLLRPAAVATFPGGGLLVADTGNNAIRRVLPDGRVFTVAGIGTPGSAGDGGSAVAAQLNQPADVWAAANGTILVADAGSNKVRLISPTGAIMTVAGSASGSAGRAPSTTPSPATSVRLANPQGVRRPEAARHRRNRRGRQRRRRRACDGRNAERPDPGPADDRRRLRHPRPR